ncbi:MAG TPA: Nudix family hydrolase [Burkholderiales bacterium]|nr:Nudix family hydrolase [Burkholderiales bacterium]
MSATPASQPAAPQASAVVDVVAAVIIDSDDRFLLAQRPPGKVYAGYWEFPGGKVESGETRQQALARELQEELGIGVRRAWPWITREYVYPHAAVRLHFFRVIEWSGQPQSRERQQFCWQRAEAPDVAPMLPANAPVLAALKLPPVYAISQAEALGETRFLERLRHAIGHGTRLIQLREKQLDPDVLLPFAAQVMKLAHGAGARVLLNGTPQLAAQAGADGVHLPSAVLMRLRRRPDLPLVAASCHDRAELGHAAALGIDFVVLGPVLPTPSHPASVPLGWSDFSALIDGYPLPVYALGGLSAEMLDTARARGAHGIAMLRGAWHDPDTG